MGLGIKAGALLDFGDLAADVRDLMDAFAIHRRGVKAHETAFLDDLAVGIQLADRHVIRVGRTVHTARMRSLGKRQQQGRLEIAHGVVFDTQIVAGQALAHQTGEAQKGTLVVVELAALDVAVDHEFFITQKGEVVLDQPLQEILDLGFFTLVHRVRGLVDQGEQVTHLGFHRLEVGHRNAHFDQYLLQLPGQRAHVGGIGTTVDLQIHQRFLQHILAGSAFGQHLEQLATGTTAHAKHGGLQGMDAVAAAVEFGAHRVDQKRQVVVQHFDGGVGGLPAVAFVVRVIDPHLGLGVLEAGHKTPGRQGATGEVG